MSELENIPVRHPHRKPVRVSDRVLLQALFDHGRDMLAAGIPPVQVRRVVKDFARRVHDILREYAENGENSVDRHNPSG